MLAPTQNSKWIELPEEFDAPSALELKACFQEASEAQAEEVWLDMRQVRFMDSSGVGAIVFLYKRLAARGIPLVLFGPIGQPADLIRMLRIDRTIPVTFGAIQGDAA